MLPAQATPHATEPAAQSVQTQNRETQKHDGERGGERRYYAPLPPIQVRPGPAGRLIVRVSYSTERVAKIKKIADRRWHAREKYWTVPHAESALSQLLTVFGGESGEVDPSLRPASDSGTRPTTRGPVYQQAGTVSVKLLDQVRHAIRTRHYSQRTEKAYVHWIKRFTGFHDRRHSAEMGEAEIGQFLSSLALHRRVSASTQNQALNAVLFLYREVFGKEIGYVNGVVRAKRPARLPVVLSRQEVRAILARLDGNEWIMGMLLYGAGLRLMECLRLRVKDVDFSCNEIRVRSGKGNKDRVTMLPAVVKEPLRRHLEQVRQDYDADVTRGFAGVPLPDALARKYPNAAKDWGWYWVFPASELYRDPRSGITCR